MPTHAPTPTDALTPALDREPAADRLRRTFGGQSVFLTGHTGFKGAWMVALLDALGARTTGYALPPETEPSLYEKIGGDALCRSIIGDLRDRDALTHALLDSRPRFVIHFAAQSLVRRSYREPADTFGSNVMGTVNLLEAARALGGRCDVVVITTDKVYAESPGGRAYVEGDPLGGHDTYSASKACCELVCDSYRKSFFSPAKFDAHGKSLATARAGNVIGGGDWCEDRLIPDLARAMAAGRAVRIRNPASTRPWQHVLEPLTGYLQLAACLASDPTQHARAYNFGPGADDVLPVEQVIQTAIKAWGGGSYFLDQDPAAPHEAALLRIDSTRARQSLHWTPRYDAKTAIRKTIEWYRHAAGEGGDALAYTRKQIAEYLRN